MIFAIWLYRQDRALRDSLSAQVDGMLRDAYREYCPDHGWHNGQPTCPACDREVARAQLSAVGSGDGEEAEA